MTIAVDWDVKNLVKPKKKNPDNSQLFSYGSDIMSCIKIKPLVVMLCKGGHNNVRHIWQNLGVFNAKKIKMEVSWGAMFSVTHKKCFENRQSASHNLSFLLGGLYCQQYGLGSDCFHEKI